MIFNKNVAANLTFFALLSAFFFSLCQCSKPPKNTFLDEHCQYIPGFDTVQIEVSDDGDTEDDQADTIPNALFFKDMPKEMLQEIDYLADSAASTVMGLYHFPATDSTEIYLVQINLSWFEHLSLFLFDKSKKAFTQRLTLAEWYGGESGQVLTGSWMFDYDKDGHYDIVRREIAHSSMLVGDDVQEHFDESAALFLWKNDGFEAAPVADSAAMIKRYPIKSKW